LAQVLLGAVVDSFKFGGAVGKLHHGHARAAVVEEFFADAFEDRQGQGRGAGGEIVRARARALGGGGGESDVADGGGHGSKTFRVNLRCVGAAKARPSRQALGVKEWTAP